MDISHFVTLVLAAGGALSAAIGILYKTILDTNSKHADLKEEVGQLKGRHEGITKLSAEVLETVHRATRGQDPKDP